jgi:putative oxidoreductase
MESKGIPGMLLSVVIALEIVGSIAVIAGWRVRFFLFLLAGYTLLAAFFFHTNFSDPMQYYSFLKNLGVAGGLLFLTVHGAGKFSLDARKQSSP